MNRDDHEKRIRAAMLPLVGEPHFEAFIAQIRQQREISVEDACRDAVIANERSHLAAIGEVRCYTNVLAIYDDLVANRPLESEAVDQE
jgi:hypothetical protein